MDKQFQIEEKQNSEELTQRIEQTISGTKITNLGWMLIVRLTNGSIFTVTILTSKLCDVAGTDCNEKRYERQNISWDTAMQLLVQISKIISPEAIDESSRLDEPFGRDPLGKKRHEISLTSEMSSTDSTSSFTESNILNYLAEMLPVDESQIEGNKLTLTIDCVQICITAQPNGQFSVESFVGSDAVQAVDNLPVAQLIKWTFSICGQIQSRLAQRDGASKEIETENPSVWKTIRELAKETGESGGDDPVRNKNIFDLKQGLCVSRNPFEQTESLSRMTPQETTSSIRGSTMHNGHPVSLNENRDQSRPFQDTLGGKALVYLPGTGATLVHKSQLPKKLKLNWTPEHGVIFTDESVPTNSKGMWKFNGWQ